MIRDTLAPTLWLFASTGLLLGGCGASPEQDPVVLGAALAHDRAVEPIQDVLVWTFDEDGATSTTWLRGNDVGGAILATREGLILTAGEGVWELVREDVEIPLCDCEAWRAVELEGGCPVADEPAIVSVPVLLDHVSGKRLHPVKDPVASTEDETTDVEFEFHATIVSSVGPYLFFRSGQRSMGCEAAHDTWSEAFTIFDLVAEETTDLFTEEERAAIMENEQAAAFEQIRTDNLVDVESVEDLTLTVIEPILVRGLGLTFRYQFTASSSFAHSDGDWGAYSRSITVPAYSVPEALEPYLLLPRALTSFHIGDSDVQAGGWMPVTGSMEQVSALARAFETE